MFFSLKSQNKIITLLSITIFLLSFFVFNSSVLGAAYGDYGLTDTLGVKPTSEGRPLSTSLAADDLSVQAGTIIGAALSFIGVIFLILMIYGGFKWMTAGGNEEETKKAKELIFAAVVGLMIIGAAYLVTKFIGETLISP